MSAAREGGTLREGCARKHGGRPCWRPSSQLGMEDIVNKDEQHGQGGLTLEFSSIQQSGLAAECSLDCVHGKHWRAYLCPDTGCWAVGRRGRSLH